MDKNFTTTAAKLAGLAKSGDTVVIPGKATVLHGDGPDTTASGVSGIVEEVWQYGGRSVYVQYQDGTRVKIDARTKVEFAREPARHAAEAARRAKNRALIESLIANAENE